MFIKKLLVNVLIAVFMIAVFFPTVIAASNGLTIDTERVTAKAGETVDVKLTVTGNPGISSLVITVKTPDGIVQKSYKNGEIIQDLDVGKNMLWSDHTDSTAIGTLVTLTYEIGETVAAGEYTVEIVVRECFNDEFKSVNVTKTNGKIVVEGDLSPETESETASEQTEQITTEQTTESDSSEATETITAETENSVSSSGSASGGSGGGSGGGGYAPIDPETTEEITEAITEAITEEMNETLADTTESALIESTETQEMITDTVAITESITEDVTEMISEEWLSAQIETENTYTETEEKREETTEALTEKQSTEGSLEGETVLGDQTETEEASENKPSLGCKSAVNVCMTSFVAIIIGAVVPIVRKNKE